MSKGRVVGLVAIGLFCLAAYKAPQTETAPPPATDATLSYECATEIRTRLIPTDRCLAEGERWSEGIDRKMKDPVWLQHMSDKFGADFMSDLVKQWNEVDRKWKGEKGELPL